MEIRRKFIVGLDLGTERDYSAAAIVEVVPGHLVAQSSANLQEATLARLFPPLPGSVESVYYVRQIKRWPLGTSYVEIAESVKRRFLDTQLYAPGYAKPVLVVDKTGVGRPVLDQLRAQGLTPLGIGITGAGAVNKQGPRDATVPKRDLALTLQILFQSKRIKLAKNLDEMEALVKELQAFKMKISQSGHDTYEAERESAHDDLVLSVCLAVWLGEYGEKYGLAVNEIRPLNVVDGGWKGWT